MWYIIYDILYIRLHILLCVYFMQYMICVYKNLLPMLCQKILFPFALPLAQPESADICLTWYWDFSNRRKFRSQTSDNMDRWKAEMGRVREEKRRRKRKSQKKEDPGARKGRKVAKHCVFPMICGSGGSKSRLAKADGAEPSGQMRDEKLHAVVARSTFRSQNVQNTPLSDHFWKLRCRKSARRCGAKHISKSKCTKHRAPEHFWRLRCRKSARRCGAKHISKSKV